MMVHTINPSIQEAEVGIASSELAWLHSATNILYTLKFFILFCFFEG